MSSKNPPFKDYRYQYQQNSSFRSPTEIKKSSKQKIENSKMGRFSTFTAKKPIESSLLTENQEYYRFQYIFQDTADDTNIVFFDSISRKYRTRSTTKTRNPKALTTTSNTMNKVHGGVNKSYAPKNNISGNRNQNYNLAKNNNQQLKSNNKPISNNIGSNKNNDISNKNTQIRQNVMRGMKNVIGDLMDKNNIQRPNQNSSIRKEVMGQMKKAIDGMLNKNEANKKNEPSKNQNKADSLKNIQKNIANSRINNEYNNKQNQALNRQNKPDQKTLSQNKVIPKNDISNIISPGKTKNEQSQNLNQEPQNQNVLKNLDKNNNLNKNQGNNIPKDINQEQNLEKSQRKEEKTIVIIPGQTIEKRTVNVDFENPTEEAIENPDGTFSLILKQKKITTITENIPVEAEKIKSIEGSPKLPIYKQVITYNYQTITSPSQKSGIKDSKFISQEKIGEGDKEGINKNLNSDSNNGLSNGLNNDLNRNLNDEINNDLNNGFNNEENFDENKDKNKLGEGDSLNKEENSHFDPNIIPKEFKNEKELEQFLDELNQKGENLSPEEKEKRMNCLKDIFDNIAKGGNPEQNLEKLSQLLSNMSEKDRKEFLKKLAEEGKNPDLLKKLEKMIEKNVNKNRLLKSGKSGSKKGVTSPKKFGSAMKSQFSEDVEVKQINPLKFDGLFLEISEYNNGKREKNPFDGLSPYMKFYEERKSIIKKKIDNMTSGDFDQNKIVEFKLEEEK